MVFGLRKFNDLQSSKIGLQNWKIIDRIVKVN